MVDCIASTHCRRGAKNPAEKQRLSGKVSTDSLFMKVQVGESEIDLLSHLKFCFNKMDDKIITVKNSPYKV